jgi:hypothetical protein
MSLPACQQRVLDGIAESLRATEPKLAAMFAIFTRLCRNEAPPLGEQLAARAGFRAWLAGLIRRPAGRRKHPATAWVRALIISQVTMALVLFAVLIGTVARAPGCANAPLARSAVVSGTLHAGCPAGQVGEMARK